MSNDILGSFRVPEMAKISSTVIDFCEELEEDKNYLNITDYTYSALCLLGKSDDPEYHTEPCFPMSRVDPYKFSMDDKFEMLMNELKDGLKKISTCYNNIIV